MAPAGKTSPLIRRHAFPCGRSSHGLTGFTGANPRHVRSTCFWGQLHVLTTVIFHSGCPATSLPVLTPPIWRLVARQRHCPVWVIIVLFISFVTLYVYEKEWRHGYTLIHIVTYIWEKDIILINIWNNILNIRNLISDHVFHII